MDKISPPLGENSSDCVPSPMKAADSSGWSASQYNKTASFVYSTSFIAPVLALLDTKPGERIFDFGCGSGEVTLQIAEMVGKDGVVVGVDLSDSMIEKAKANGVQHAFVSDIQYLLIPEPISWIKGLKFDTVFSNASLHWCKQNPAGVLESAKGVLKCGGKFVGEMGGFMNCVGVRSALHAVLKRRGYDPVALDPWYFPSVDSYRKLLLAAGFEPTHISLHPRMTHIPEGLLAWLRLFVRNSFLRELNDEEAEKVMQEVASMCEVDCKDGEGSWVIMYMRLRFSAILTG